MADVVFENVTKRFGKVAAVENLTLEIEDGEFIVLLGPTGAGKTTTLRLAGGLETPDHGRILIGGNDVTHAPSAVRDVAFVFQQYSLYPHFTVFDNMAFPLRAPLRRTSAAAIKERVTEIARLLRIEDKLDNRATQLSGGEMQRVAIGRALVREPAAFLMDEPLSSLDAKLREDLRVELKRIQVDMGATILYVTHDQIEAMTMADRIGVLREGRLVQVGTPRQVYAEPETDYVALRLGSPRINLLPMGALGITEGPAGAETIGIRPEDVVLGRGDGLGEVLTVEHLGAETVVLLRIGGHEVHALAGPGEPARPGDRVIVSTLPEAALYFDRDGRRLPWRADGASKQLLEAGHGA
ncbi:MAG: ABC transporter ATP-binding protein [Alphaproteobacteria bacterium]|nr:MAG: ABC transporter ATP-binding protein [Alphaproteobacteria bacterium]